MENQVNFWKRTVVVLAVIVIVLVGYYWYLSRNSNSNQGTLANDYKSATYEIEGIDVALVDGISEIEAAPGSASKITTKYFGNEATGDLNGDGIPDVAFLLTQDQGGSGTFYYVVAAVKMGGGWQGTNAILLGDRVAPQTTEIRSGQIIANYAVRKENEPMTARPSIGVSKYFEVKNGKIVEI